MDLHRSEAKPDWELTLPRNRTAIQKLAFVTHGVITPPNIITFIGLFIVLYGLYALLLQDFWVGLIALGIGRLLDIIDGVVAHSTGTKSPLGELLDASVDKIVTLLTVIAFYAAGISYWWLITLLLLPQIIIPLVVFYKRTKNIKIHPTRIGKLSMAFLWVGLLGLIVIEALALSWAHPLALSVYATTLLSTVFGLYALWQYSTGRD